MGIRPVPWSFTIEFDEGRAESAGYDVEELYGCTGRPNEGLRIDPVEQARRIREAE